MATISGGRRIWTKSSCRSIPSALHGILGPDSGMSLVLLVLGLAALGVFARFRKQASV